MQKKITHILESMTDGFAIYNREWRIIFVNERAAQIGGKTHEELIGKIVWEVYPEAVGSKFYREYHRAIAEQIPVHIQEFFPTLKIWVEVRAYPSQDGLAVYLQDITERKTAEIALQRAYEELETRLEERTAQLKQAHELQAQLVERQQAREGQTVGSGIILADITETKQAEAAAREANQKVVNILESITDGFMTFDREWRFTYLNHEGARTLGREVEELLGKNVWEEFPQLGGTSFGQLYQRAVAEGVSLQLEDYFPPFEAWFAVRAYPSKAGLSLYFQNITDRKQAEEALRQSEERFRVALKNSPIMVFNQDRELRYTWFHNPHPSYEVESLIGKTEEEIAPPDVAARLTEIKQAAIASAAGVREEIQIVIDGVLRTYDLTVEPLYDEAGAVTGITSAAVDITERKQAEEALKESEERFRAMFDQAAVGIAQVALDGRFIQVNPALCHITGYSYDELIQMTFPELTHPDDLQSDLAKVEEVLARKIEGYSLEKRYICKDGSIVWINLTSSAVWDENGQPKYAVGIIEDISDRKRAEVAQHFLVESSTLLAASLDYETTLTNVAQLAVPALADWCLVDIFQEDWTIRQVAIACVNPEKQKILHDLRDRYSPAPGGKHPLMQILRKGESIFYSELPDSQLVAIAHNEEHLQLLRDLGIKSLMAIPLLSHGQLFGAISFLYAESGRCYDRGDLALAEDIARRAATAIDNARLYREAQKANRQKDEFLAILSDELRTPLHGLLGWIQVIQKQKLNEKAIKKAIEIIERKAREQKQVIEDLLHMSRIITGKLTLNPRWVALSSIISQTINTLRLAADAKSIRLEFNCAPSVGLMWGDPERLQQVVWNLLSNALKFTPRGGRVEIRLSVVTGQAKIEAIDTGQGISAEFLPYVFDRFRQADSTNTRPYKGLGLGLAIVRYLVELHGGTVCAFSEGEGKGATFTVQIPLLEKSEGRGLVGEKEHETSPLTLYPSLFTAIAGLRVLLVEDDADTRVAIGFILEEYGAEVIEVDSASEALNALERLKPDIVIGDIGMLEENGYSLISKVRTLEAERGRQIPAIALTAYAREEEHKRALSAGFQKHIPKPIELEELVKAVATMAVREPF